MKVYIIVEFGEMLRPSTETAINTGLLFPFVRDDGVSKLCARKRARHRVQSRIFPQKIFYQNPIKDHHFPQGKFV